MTGRLMAMVLLLAGITAGGCRPTLRDGYYACERTPECPPSMFCWSSDQLCHAQREMEQDAAMTEQDAARTEQDASAPADAGAPRDSGSVPVDAWAPRRDSGRPPPPDGGRMDCGACPAPGRCVGGVYCSLPCSSADTCPGGSALHVCANGQCLPSCTSSAECPSPLVCAAGEWTSGVPNAGACADPTMLQPTGHGAPCGGGCLAPDSCIADACMRSCSTTGVACEGDESCRPLRPELGPGAACVVVACTGTGMGSCAPGFVCTAPPMGPTQCQPTAWVPPPM